MRKSLSTPRGWCKTARLSFEARNDGGMSLIELVVAVLIITIVLLAGLTAIDFGLTTTNAQRLKVEATNLALTTMEQDEPLASTLSIGQTTTTQTINTTTFTIVSTISEFDQSGGTLTSTCTSNATSQSQQIWQIVVAVSWTHMKGLAPISQSTEVAPGESTAQDLANAELAVGVEGSTELPLTTPLNFTVTPVATTATPPYVAPVPPAGNTSPVGVNFNTGSNGCGVVAGLSTAGWTYTVTLVNNPGWVSSTEASDVNSAGDPSVVGLQSLAGQVTRVSPVLQMAPGDLTSITLQPVTYTCAGGNPALACEIFSPLAAGYALPVATLPIAVSNTSLAGGQYTFNPAGTTVDASTPELLYPYPIYNLWAGDMPQSNPGYSAPATGLPFYTGASPLTETPAPVALLLPTPPAAPPSATAAIVVPTYDLSVHISSACAGASLVATEQAGKGLSFPLNTAVLGTSASGMPLGQYLLSSTGGSCPALASAGGLYVWITPTGVYQATSEITTSPYTAGTPIATAASVQVTE